ncbi:protein adenylyltransferase SelO [Pseudodesulfovibrio portus]|uniref:Protein nucleotidyltransferase YdiU n=1 Tax=Pseudodesulfovibrio portus TaxID=231439 RepID=A0ABM8AR19_9BACT|nr:YdiU family protein [Pseudodesulfovibrio portus]BDQ33869.1 UPF0061 protein [Pseudodesulfovibrio portus]
MTFDNSYARLPDKFFQRIHPVPVAEPRLIALNRPLAAELELDLPEDDAELAAVFSGNSLLPGTDPIAQAYAGHQFGHFVPQLGDGRAVLLGEVVTSHGRRYDIQLKGSGKTRFSRGGDGRSPLGPVIREYIVSEAMHALGIPTSRALAMTATGETVFRETDLPGGVLTRVADSFVRVGTFEYFAAREDEDAVRQLADYVIDRHYPQCRDAANPYVALFGAVCRAKAELVARWLCVGFIHGVMNTDNTAVSGQTIDYGPCAFMDAYDPARVFSSIDHQGRYGFNQQANIAMWNMACLGGCLLPLFHADPEQARKEGDAVIEGFAPAFTARYREGLCRKIGLEPSNHGFELARNLLGIMHRDRTDFTVTFRTLAESTADDAGLVGLFSSGEDIRAWTGSWRAALRDQGISDDAAARVMRDANPACIPRNHRIEEAIRAAEDKGDFQPALRLAEVLARPFEAQPGNDRYAAPPRPEELVHQTFCGT